MKMQMTLTCARVRTLESIWSRRQRRLSGAGGSALMRTRRSDEPRSTSAMASTVVTRRGRDDGVVPQTRVWDWQL
jgi:hypothetical protein